MHKTLAILVFAAACGDNRQGTPDSAPPDAPAVKPRAIVVSGDFTPGATGVMSKLDLESMTVDQRVAPNTAVGNDPMLRKIGDELFVVNRYEGNSVTILDAATLQVKEQLATGAGSNPQDVAVAGGKLFVPGFDTAGVVVLTRGSTTPVTVDLSTLDPDGKPNCMSAYTVGSEVYVACGLLDENFLARGPGKVVVLDAATNAVKTIITMANVNPIGMFEKLPDDLLGGDLVIPTVKFVSGAPPDFTVGCVERIKPGAAPAANGCTVTNAMLSGFVARLDVQVVGSEAYQWMVVSNGLFGDAAKASLQGFDLHTLELWPAPISLPGELLVDAVVCPTDQVVVADKTMAANGLRVFQGSAEKTSAPLPIGLKPGSNHGLVCY